LESVSCRNEQYNYSSNKKNSKLKHISAASSSSSQDGHKEANTDKFNEVASSSTVCKTKEEIVFGKGSNGETLSEAPKIDGDHSSDDMFNDPNLDSDSSNPLMLTTNFNGNEREMLITISRIVESHLLRFEMLNVRIDAFVVFTQSINHSSV